MTERLSEDIRRLIDGELDAREVARVLHEAADDNAARDLLCMEFEMRRAFEEQREAPWAVPAGFSERVMEHVRHRSAEAVSRTAVRTRVATWIKRATDALVTARPIMVRPAYALASILLLALGALVVLNRPFDMDVEGRDGATFVRQAADADSDDLLVPFFYVNGEASSVAVAGDFNEWEPTPLQRKVVDGRIIWSGLLPVSPGEHRYMFVIDGSRWESDPLAPVHRDDGFGNTNAILAL